MIQRASLHEVPEIMALIKAAIHEMRRNDIDQWDELYPDRADIENDITSKALYKYDDNGTVAAIVTINNESPPEYDVISWSDTTGKYMVIHRLTVHPVYQRRGIAAAMMQFCETLALQLGISSIRLDAFTNNQKACNLYHRLEYVNKGTVTFRKGLFFCFEKAMNAAMPDSIVLPETDEHDTITDI